MIEAQLHVDACTRTQESTTCIREPVALESLRPKTLRPNEGQASTLQDFRTVRRAYPVISLALRVASRQNNAKSNRGSPGDPDPK